MTNLTEKFDELQTQLTTQYTSMAESLSNIQLLLESIATALGAPPPGGATLNDVITAINGFESTVASQFVDIYAVMGQMNTRLGTIGINTENIYFGQRDLENTILATACPCDSGNPPLPAPPADLPQPEDGLYCQRIQYMLDQFKLELTDFEIAKASGPISSTIVNEILTERATTNIVGAPAGSVISGTVSALNTVSSGFLSAFNALRTDLMFAIYGESTTEGAKEAYNTVVTSAEGSYGPLFRNIGYQDWFNSLFDTTGAPWPVSSYDDGACTTATEYPNSSAFTDSPGESIALWSSPVIMVNAPPSMFTVYITDQVFGWIMRNDSAYPLGFFGWNSSNVLIINTGMTIMPGATYTFSTHFDHGYVGRDVSGGNPQFVAGDVVLIEP